jgi:uncharacterized protein YuzE
LQRSRLRQLKQDFNRDGKLMGIEVIEASKVMGKKIEIKLPELSAA